jgi:two-component system response regulator
VNQAREMEILLVEDNEDDAAMTLRALRKANFVNGIRVARDGAEALAILFGTQPDGPPPAANLPRLILLDLKLPKIDGLQVLQRIKNDPRTRVTPVVILTSSQEQRDVVESYGLGVNSYIVKPVNFEGFVEAVCKLGMYWLLLNHPPG